MTLDEEREAEGAAFVSWFAGSRRLFDASWEPYTASTSLLFKQHDLMYSTPAAAGGRAVADKMSNRWSVHKTATPTAPADAVAKYTSDRGETMVSTKPGERTP